jgi:hypothetical protein
MIEYIVAVLEYTGLLIIMMAAMKGFPTVYSHIKQRAFADNQSKLSDYPSQR